MPVDVRGGGHAQHAAGGDMYVVLDRCRGRCVLDRNRYSACDAHAAARGGSLVVRRAFGALRAAVFLLRLVTTELGLLVGGVVDRLVVGVAVVVRARTRGLLPRARSFAYNRTRR